MTDQRTINNVTAIAWYPSKGGYEITVAFDDLGQLKFFDPVVRLGETPSRSEDVVDLIRHAVIRKLRGDTPDWSAQIKNDSLKGQNHFFYTDGDHSIEYTEAAEIWQFLNDHNLSTSEWRDKMYEIANTHLEWGDMAGVTRIFAIVVEVYAMERAK